MAFSFVRTDRHPRIPTSLGSRRLRVVIALAVVAFPLMFTAAGPGGAASTGLVASYAFDEGSGTQAGDSSGNSRTGTISGATWVTGRYGSGLSFDGVNDSVSLPALGTFYNSGFTLEAWVQKQGPKVDVAAVGSWAGGSANGGPMVWVHHQVGRYHLTLTRTASNYLDSGQAPAVGQWQHLAATFDGTTARFYVNGVETANRAFTGNVGDSNVWRIGAYGPTAGGFFDGIIDEVRIYNRAITPAEVQSDMTTGVGPPDVSPPSAPTNFAAGTATDTSIATSWTASNDDRGVAYYNVYRGSTKVASPTSTSYTFTGLICGTQYTFGVEAVDGGNNVSGRTTVTASTLACGAPTPPGGLVAAYGFDEGTGTTTADKSGNGKTATVVGPTWTVGRFGEALSFDGVNDRVDLPALGTFYDTRFTLSAWVKKQGTKTDSAVVGSWVGGSQNGGPMVWVHSSVNRYHLTLNRTQSTYLDSGRAPTTGQWQYVAATFDGATARFYVDGVETANRAYTGNVGDSNTWRVGAYGPGPIGFFDGAIDEVRIYSRALSAAEIQTDMNAPVPRDTVPPTTPGNLTANGAVNGVTLSWAASSDNFGIVRYDVFRSTTAGFTPSSANQITQTTTASYSDPDLTPGTYYYRVIAEDSSGNMSSPSNQATAVVPVDTTPPTVSITTPAGGASVWGTVSVIASASDNNKVAGVQFMLNGAPLGAEDTASPYSVAWNTGTVPDGPYTLTAVARDPAGNTRASAPVNVTVNSSFAPPGLVAAYGFEEPTGTLAADGSGNGNGGTVNGATRTTDGRYGSALAFDGVNDSVDLPGLGSFYKTGFTLEAWVRKQSAATDDNGVVGTWVGGTQGGGPMLWVSSNGIWTGTLATGLANYLTSGQAPVAGQWQHVAFSYNGSTARFYVNGTEVANRSFTGNVGDSNTWRIGAYGSTAMGFFDGTIDEVRIYNRALTQTEIEGDMSAPVPRDNQPPTIASVTPASGAAGVSVGATVTARFSEPMDPATITTSTIGLATASGTAVPATVTYDAPTRTATLTPAAALAFGTQYRVTIEGGPTDPRVKDVAGNALAADTTWTFTTQTSASPILLLTSSSRPFSSYAAEILKAEGLNSYTTLDISRLSISLLNAFSVAVVGEMPLTPTDVATLTSWVNSGGRLITLRPDTQLAEPPRDHLPGHDAHERLPAREHRERPWRGDRRADHPVPRPGRPLLGDRGDVGRHALLERHRLDHEPGRDHQERGVERRPGGRVHVRPRALRRLHAPGQPGLGRTGPRPRRRRRRDHEHRPLLRRRPRRRAARLGQPRQGRDPAGRRAAAAAREHDRADEPRPDADAALLVPAARPEGGGRHDRRRPRPRGDRTALRRVQGREPGRAAPSPTGRACAPPRTCTRTRRSRTLRRPRTTRTASSSQPTPTTASAAATRIPRRSTPTTRPSWPTSPPPSRACPRRRRRASTASPGATGSRTRRSRLAHGIRMDTNYYYYPFDWTGDRPGWWTGSGFPMPFADTDGTKVDVYQLATQMPDETTGDRSEDIYAARLDRD